MGGIRDSGLMAHIVCPPARRHGAQRGLSSGYDEILDESEGTPRHMAHRVGSGRARLQLQQG